MKKVVYNAIRLTGSHTPAGRRGFSLIELLCAVAILMMLVIMLGSVFTETNRSWAMGTGRAENNTTGRAAINMIADDLQYAIADRVITFAMQTTDKSTGRDTFKTYGADNSEVCMLSVREAGAANESRSAQEIHYYVKEHPQIKGLYVLRRGYFSKELLDKPMQHAYRNRSWYKTGGARVAPPLDPDPDDASVNPGRPSGGGDLAENVACLRFFVPNPLGATLPPIGDYLSEKFDDRLPEYIDIYLEILDPRTAIQAADMSTRGGMAEKVNEFVERNLRRYTKRVYFHNREGYRHPH